MRQNRQLWIATWVSIISWLIMGVGSSRASSLGEGFREEGLAGSAAWEATVLLEKQEWSGRSGFHGRDTGSGVIVGFDAEPRWVWIATSAHVVDCGGACRVRAFFPDGRRNRAATVEVVWLDTARDLALLRAKAPRDVAIRVAPTTDALPPSGSAIVAIGFPDLWLLTGETRSGRAATPGKRFSTGRLTGSPVHLAADFYSYGSRTRDGTLDLDRALTHDAALLPGSSGGPLIDAAGRVLAVNTGSLTTSGEGSCADQRDACRTHLAVPLGEIVEKLAELRASEAH